LLDKKLEETVAKVPHGLTLLKYSKILARQARIHSAIQAKIAASPLLRASLASVRRAWTIATNKEPKQIDPKDVVTVRIKELHTALEQHPDSSGATHYIVKEAIDEICDRNNSPRISSVETDLPMFPRFLRRSHGRNSEGLVA
jgi:hypothetical protein